VDGGGRILPSVDSDLAYPESGSTARRGSFVLPRLVRRPARLVERLARGDFELPRHAFSAVAATYLIAMTGYGAVLGGHVAPALDGSSAAAGMSISDIRITGNRHTGELDILEAVGLTSSASLVAFDPHAARDRVAQLPWVERAAVMKVYPATLRIEITEKKPFALWQNDGVVSVIDRDGQVIAINDALEQGDLPLVIGAGAERNAAPFLAVLNRVPEVAAQVLAVVRVGDRRWDLRFADGMTIKLPERNFVAALGEVAQMVREDGLLDKDVVAVDLRVADRITLQLGETAMLVQGELAKERLKAAKEKGARI
jgi:cell division protein FtsQ